MRQLFILFLLFFSVTLAEKQPKEYRAMWVTRFEMTSTKNISEIINTAVSNNFNTLFVQVCGRGTAFYNSTILPKDTSVPSFDPLADILDKAKKNNIEIHAWINTLYVWSDKEKPLAANHVLNSHSSWLFNNGQSCNGSYFLNPAEPDVKKYIRNVCVEVIKKYPVAGIHLDYTRLPGKKFAENDELACREFEKTYNINPRALINNKEVALRVYGEEDYKKHLEKWGQYNRDNVSAVVKEVADGILKTNPDCILSAAVIADNEQAYNDFSQDWPSWMDKGYLDLVIPMAYSTKEDLVRKQIVFATQQAEKSDCQLLIGLGAWQQKPETIIKLIRYTQKIREKLGFPQLAGVVLFSYDKIKTDNYLDKLRHKVFSNYAIRPEISMNKKKLVEKTGPQEQNNKNENPEEIDLKYHSNIIG